MLHRQRWHPMRHASNVRAKGASDSFDLAPSSSCTTYVQCSMFAMYFQSCIWSVMTCGMIRAECLEYWTNTIVDVCTLRCERMLNGLMFDFTCTCCGVWHNFCTVWGGFKFAMHQCHVFVRSRCLHSLPHIDIKLSLGQFHDCRATHKHKTTATLPHAWRSLLEVPWHMCGFPLI